MLVSEAFTITEQRLTEMAAFHPIGVDQEANKSPWHDYTEPRPTSTMPPSEYYPLFKPNEEWQDVDLPQIEEANGIRFQYQN
jgi:hypothetical protein